MQPNSSFRKWKTWTYKNLFDKYKKFIEKDDSAGFLLTARLEYYTSWTCAMPWSSGGNLHNEDTTSFFRKLGRYLTRLLGDEAYNVYKDVKEADVVKERDILIFAVIINSKDDVTYLLTEEKEGVKHSICKSNFKLSKRRSSTMNNKHATVMLN